MRFARVWAATAAAAALMGCAPRAVVVRTDGWAAEDPARPDTATRRATADALRRAVESVSGVRLAALTRVRDGAAVSENVSARTAGCVLGYQVLSERSAAGGRSVRVRARVARSAGDCGGAPEGAGARVALSYTGLDPAGRDAGRAAAAALGAELARRGWEVVEGTAPLTVAVEAACAPARDSRLEPLSGASVELDVRVLTRDGRVLGRSASHAAAADVDADAAARRAAGAAARDAAGPAAGALSAGFWAALDD